jgi:glyoxylase-like metal-dependent hydrolase (beta-lactamase superfamily II)
MTYTDRSPSEKSMNITAVLDPRRETSLLPGNTHHYGPNQRVVGADMDRGGGGAAADPRRGLGAELYAQVTAGADTALPVVPARVDHEVDGDTIDLGGGVRAVCVAALGHTPGSVAFHLPEAGALFAGDTIARGWDGAVMLGVFNSDPPGAIASFRKQAALSPRIACFGHGDPLTENTAAQLRAAAASAAQQ